jgi:Tol biopolymer transport system component
LRLQRGRSAVAAGFWLAATFGLAAGSSPAISVHATGLAAPAFPNRIVFVRGANFHSGGGDLYVSNGDGSNEVRLTTDGLNNSPKWSPDGQSIVFTSTRDVPSCCISERSIYTIKEDGTGLQRLTFRSQPTASDPQCLYCRHVDRDPAWSPSGNKIIFTRDDQLMVIGRLSAEPVPLTVSTPGRVCNPGPCHLNGFQPGWSPAGDKIVFASDFACGSVPSCTDIYVAPAEGGSQTQLTDLPPALSSLDGSPDWSPDGTLILFASNRDRSAPIRSMEMYVMNAPDGSGLRRLFSYTDVDAATGISIGDVSSAVWSSDGMQVLFEAGSGSGDGYGGSGLDIWVGQSDGTQPHRIILDGHRPDARCTQATCTAPLPACPSGTVAQGFFCITYPSQVRAVLPALANAAYGGYSTTVYVQNLAGTSANLGIEYFDQSGQSVGSGDLTANLPAHAMWTVPQNNGRSFNVGGAGSAVIFSDQPVAAFVNEFAPGNSSDATSYTAIASPTGTASTLFAPAIASKAYGGYTTGIGLINLSAMPTDVTITYRDFAGATAKTQTLTGVPAGAYRGIYSGDSGSPTDAKLPADFAGTATITSGTGQPLAAVVNEVGPGGQFSSYDAVAAGSTTLQAPVALNNAFGGYHTGIGVQNTTATAGIVTVKYFDAAGAATTRVFPIAPHGYVGIYQGSLTDGPAPGAYTAQISSGVAIASIVNEVAPAGTGGAQRSTAYNTFAGGAATANLALVENAGSDGWSTALGIMNTGAAVTSVNVRYYDASTGAAVGTAQANAALQPNAFWPVYQPDAGLPAGQRATAVVTTGAGGTVAVICNETNATSFMSYDAQ